MNKPLISVICPVRDEQSNLLSIFADFKPLNAPTELLFVEGGSRDHSWYILKKIDGRTNNHGVSFRSFKQQGAGKAGAVATGFNQARGKYLIIFDADQTVRKTGLQKILNLFNQYGDQIIASGNRLKGLPKPHSFYWLNYFGNYFFRYWYSLAFNTKVYDIACGSKAMTQSTWLKLKPLRNRGGYLDNWGDIDWLYYGIQAGCKLKFADVDYFERGADESKLQHMYTRWHFAATMFLLGLKIWYWRISK